MSRPFKCRRVCFLPGITYFKPAGIPLRMLTENQLTVEEMEAIRIRDLEHLEQEECAQKMDISRPTFQRVLTSARRKIADSLVAGKALRIEGGNFELAFSRFRCLNGHVWDMPLAKTAGSASESCPVCHTPDFNSISPVAVIGRGNDMVGGQRRRYGRH
jgi:predicted DNA-binding protein (UPF0251 family)